MKKIYHYDINYTIQPQFYGDLVLYQMGELMCDVDTIVDSHVHLNWYEFTYIFSGEGVIYTNNQPTVVKKDDIYLSLPNEIHKIVSDNISPLRYFFCAFNLTEKSEIKPILNEYNNIIISEQKRKFTVPSLTYHFKNLLTAINQDSNISKLTLEYELKTAIIKAYSLLKTYNNTEYKAPKINSTAILCFNIINYIDNNITTLNNVSEIADVFGYNYSYLSRAFKKIMGNSISDYFYNKKLSIAKHMIEEGESSVSDIASALNYSSIYVFSRSFKEKYGSSPNNYKLQYQKNK